MGIKPAIRWLTPPLIYEAAATAKRRAISLFRTYQQEHAGRAAQLCNISGARVLIVGVNTGMDCRLFLERGAAEVHGVDVIEQVGRDFTHDRVTYHRAGIERTNLPARYFDLAYAVATFEHVADIEAGFAEMARVTRPGGTIYSFAAPLWQSPYGHHMGCFDGHPWIHLAFDKSQIIDRALEHGITGERGRPMAEIVDFMLNPANFNMRPGSDYISACAKLRDIRIVVNKLFVEPRAILDHPLSERAMARGYTADNLLASNHVLVATAA